MNMNFFQWLRDGVRQSVLLGVSDAVDTIGLPETENDDNKTPALASILGGEEKPKAKRGGGRKRLGKSLKEMDAA
ncbi:MAG: hypothetical protein AAFX06_20510 [Planctomycetota bacterium]